MSPLRSAEQSRLRTAAAALEAPDASSASAAVLRASTLRHSGVRHSAPRSCFSPDCARGRPPRSTHALLPSGGGVHRRHPASWLASRQRHGRVSPSSSTVSPSSSIAPPSSSAPGSPARPPPLPPPPPPPPEPRVGGLQLSMWSASPRLRCVGASQRRERKRRTVPAHENARKRRAAQSGAATAPRLRGADAAPGSQQQCCAALRRGAGGAHVPWWVHERAQQRLVRRRIRQRSARWARHRRRRMAQDGLRHAVVRPAQPRRRLQRKRGGVRRRALVAMRAARTPVHPGRSQLRPPGVGPLGVHQRGARAGSHADRCWE